MAPNRAGGAAKEGEIMSALSRAVGEGPGVLPEGFMRGIGDVNLRSPGEGVGVKWGRVMWWELQTEIDTNVTLRDGA